MPIDRTAALRDAETHLRAGKLDLAIVSYRRIVEEFPHDWTSTNALGDLYARVGEVPRAIEHFSRVAEAFAKDGFLQKAGALYKKILKLRPDDEQALLRAGELAGQQGLLADARMFLGAVASRRRDRGDIPGVEEIEALLTSFDPDDVEVRREHAQAKLRAGNVATGVRELKMLAAELTGKDRRMDALQVMIEALGFATDDPDLQLALIEVRLREGRLDDALAMTRDLLTQSDTRWLQAARLSGTLIRDVPHVAELLALEVADHLIRLQQWEPAESVIQDLQSRAPASEGARARLLLIRRRGRLEELVEPPPPAATPSASEPQEDPAIAEPAAGDGMEFELLDAGPFDGDFAAGSDELAEGEVDLSLALNAMEAPEDESGQAAGAARDPLSDRPIEDVFARMRASAPAQLVTDVADQAFSRGLHFIQRGQIDAAVVALEIAAAGPRRRFEASAALGRLHRERGDLDAAIEWLEQAAESAAPSPAANHRVLYDLADALELKGDTTRALTLCFELQAEAGDYEDVATRVERLLQQKSGGG